MIAVLLGSETHQYAFRNDGVGVVFHYTFVNCSAGHLKAHVVIIKNFPLSGQIIKNVSSSICKKQPHSVAKPQSDKNEWKCLFFRPLTSFSGEKFPYDMVMMFLKP